jgi:hypothetical protein
MRNLKLSGLMLAVLFFSLPLAPLPEGLAQKAVAGKKEPAVSSTFAAARDAANEITAAKMKEVLYFIASDAMAGRDTPSKGLDDTAKFLADRLAKLKYKPAGDDGTFFQKIELRKTEVERAKTRVEFGGKTFSVGSDFIPLNAKSGEAEAQLVYVSHGWVIKSNNINPYEGLDVKDKVMIVAGGSVNAPPGLSLTEIRALPSGDWEDPVSYARRNGAKALLFVPRAFDRTWSFATRALGRPSYQVSRFLDDGDGNQKQGDSPLTIIPYNTLLEAIFAGEQVSGKEILQKAVAGQPLKGFALSPEKRLRISLSVKTDIATTQNVVAVLEGSDKNLKKEYVALGAHYDHVGVGRPDRNGDTIYNGADDDGSGTTALLAMAEAFVKAKRPKRSILFIWHAGEEKGLWGSQYFTEYPTVPLDSIVAQLNIDMIGRSKLPGDTNPKNANLSGPNEIYVIGSKMMSTELANWSEGVNDAYFNLRFNYKYDDPSDQERLFYRSDHYNYAKKGIPIIFYFDGVHEDYHQPSDHADKIDYKKMEKVTRTVFVLASELANAAKRPTVDRQIPSDRLGR